MPTVSAASAVGGVFTRPSPTSRGLGCFVSFLFRRQNAYTADGPRAGAVCLRRLERRDGGGMRLRREGRKVGILRARKGGKRGKVGLDRRPAPNVRREKWGNETYPATPSPGAPGKFPDGQTAPQTTFSRDKPMIRRATQQRLCPQGKQRRIRTPAAPLARQGKAADARKSLPPFTREMRVCDRMARGGERTANPILHLRGRRAPCPAGASSAAQSPAAQSPAAQSPAAQSPTVQKPENLKARDPRKHESPMTCIACPSVSSMGYWATDTSVERRVCEVDARRKMSVASRTTEATWNDKSPAL